jgi:drug/metabolite transporter (DMT)-like permease
MKDPKTVATVVLVAGAVLLFMAGYALIGVCALAAGVLLWALPGRRKKRGPAGRP